MSAYNRFALIQAQNIILLHKGVPPCVTDSSVDSPVGDVSNIVKVAQTACIYLNMLNTPDLRGLNATSPHRPTTDQDILKADRQHLEAASKSCPHKHGCTPFSFLCKSVLMIADQLTQQPALYEQTVAHYAQLRSVPTSKQACAPA